MLANCGEKFGDGHLECLGMTYRIPERWNQFVEKRAPLFKRPRSQIGAGENEQVKSVEQDRVFRAAAILQKVERRHPGPVTATISPSITVSSGRRLRARVMVGNLSLKFFALRGLG